MLQISEDGTVPSFVVEGVECGDTPLEATAFSFKIFASRRIRITS
jgi:hypothetical protein